MSITVLWDNSERTIMRYIFSGRWDWSEFYAAIHCGHCAQDSQSGIVDLIFDMQCGSYIPTGAFSNFRRVSKIRHHRDGIYIAVSPAKIARPIFKTFCTFHPAAAQRYRLVDTLEQAHIIIAFQRKYR